MLEIVYDIFHPHTKEVRLWRNITNFGTMNKLIHIAPNSMKFFNSRLYFHCLGCIMTYPLSASGTSCVISASLAVLVGLTDSAGILIH